MFIALILDKHNTTNLSFYMTNTHNDSNLETQEALLSKQTKLVLNYEDTEYL